MGRNEASKSENAGEKSTHQYNNIAFLSACPQRVEFVSFPLVLYRPVCGGGYGEEERRDRKRKKGWRIKDPCVVLWADSGRSTKSAHSSASELCASLWSSSSSSSFLILPVCQLLIWADHLSCDPAHSFKVSHRLYDARKPVTRKETKAIQRMERHSQFH